MKKIIVFALIILELQHRIVLQPTLSAESISIL